MELVLPTTRLVIASRMGCEDTEQAKLAFTSISKIANRDTIVSRMTLPNLMSNARLLASYARVRVRRAEASGAFKPPGRKGVAICSE